jgi:hypothetical protein
VRSNIVLALVSAMLAAAVIEGGARLVYTRPWYEAVAVQGERVGDYAYCVNTDGLRAREIAPKPPHTSRVLMLGDSFTFGWAVHDDSAIFSARVEQALVADGQAVEVVNGGLPGSLTDAWVALWDRLADRVDPDALVIVFFLRDGTRTSSLGMFGRIRETVRAEHAASLAYRYSYAYRLVQDRLDRLRISGDYRDAFRASYFGTETERAEWIAAQEHLRALIARARARQIPVALVVFPLLIDLDDAYPFAPICDALTAFAEHGGIPALSLLPAFRGHSGPDLWVSEYDQHPNARAHAIAAEVLVPFVRTLLAGARH